jgi:hypothetical protein
LERGLRKVNFHSHYMGAIAWSGRAARKPLRN